MFIGCDLCVEPGVTVGLLTITCKPRTSRRYDCTITTPNGTNVLDINDPTGSQITVQTAGDTVSSVSISPVANPDQRPLGFDVLGTWTCECTNIDGRSVASSTLGSCRELHTAHHVCILYVSCMRRMLAGLRMGCLPLAMETGRYSNIPYCERVQYADFVIREEWMAISFLCICPASIKIFNHCNSCIYQAFHTLYR